MLTRAQWRGVVDFAWAVNARLVTSFAKQGTMPVLPGVPTKAGPLFLPPASITFFAVAAAGNASCR